MRGANYFLLGSFLCWRLFESEDIFSIQLQELPSTSGCAVSLVSIVLSLHKQTSRPGATLKSSPLSGTCKQQPLEKHWGKDPVYNRAIFSFVKSQKSSSAFARTSLYINGQLLKKLQTVPCSTSQTDFKRLL